MILETSRLFLTPFKREDATALHSLASNPNLAKWTRSFSIPFNYRQSVVSWSLSTRPDAELANTMLESAIGTLNAGERPVIHSDRGGHYRWPGWLERVNAAGLIRSMSRKGCSPDNAACEGFFGRLKTEMYYGREWSGITPENFMRYVDTYIRWYNKQRIKLSLGAISPEMYRRQLGLTQ